VRLNLTRPPSRLNPVKRDHGISVFAPVTVTGQSPLIDTTAIRVGGNVQAAKIVRQPRPEYPADLQQAGIEGTVTLKAVISKEGLPISIQTVGNGVDQRLAVAAAKAVAQWRYQPALLNGEPVETMVTIDLSFTLDQ